MTYKIRRYRNFKRRFIFETYEPEPRMRFTKENTVPILIRIGHLFSLLGGWFLIIISGLVFSVKSFFGFKKKFQGSGKTVELRIKRH